VKDSASSSFKPWAQRMARTRVIAVVTVDHPDLAERLAESLLEGGVDLMELTLRTPSALDCLRRIRTRFPELGLGAGTLLTPDQVYQAQDAGAGFGVAPGLNPRVVDAARTAGLPFAPGVFTPSDIELALDLDCPILKYFPAATQGGSSHFRTVVAPYLHRELQFIPLGGLNPENAGAFLAERGVLALGGSWIASAERIRAGDWNGIRDAAKAVRHQVHCLEDGTPR